MNQLNWIHLYRSNGCTPTDRKTALPRARQGWASSVGCGFQEGKECGLREVREVTHFQEQQIQAVLCM